MKHIIEYYGTFRKYVLHTLAWVFLMPAALVALFADNSMSAGEYLRQVAGGAAMVAFMTVLLEPVLLVARWFCVRCIARKWYADMRHDFERESAESEAFWRERVKLRDPRATFGRDVLDRVYKLHRKEEQS